MDDTAPGPLWPRRQDHRDRSDRTGAGTTVALVFGGLFLCAIATFGAGIGAVAASLDGPGCYQPSAAQIHRFHGTLTVIAMAWTAVPLVLAGVAVRLRRSPVLWLLLAGACVIVSIQVIPGAQPGGFCF